MHWLPLVAMVIASALLFPQCPVPRLVVATMEPGVNSSTNSSADSNSSDYLQNHDSNTQSTEQTRHRTADKANSLASSLLIEDSLPKRRQSPKTRLTGGDSNGAEEQTGVMSQSHKRQALHRFQDNHTLTDYKSQGGRFRDDSRFETVPESHGSQSRNKTLKGNELRSSGVVSSETSTETDRLLEVQPTGGVELEGAGGEVRRGGVVSVEGLDFEDEELMLLSSHPRVLFSTSPTPPKHPPLQLLLESGLLPSDYMDEEEEEEDYEGRFGGDGEETQEEKSARLRQESYRTLLLGLSMSENPGGPEQHPHRAARRKRQLEHVGPERSVCESISRWVMDRRTAIDSHRHNVTVLDKFPTKKGMLAQYFYETKCRGPDHRGTRGEHGVAGSGCLGVDKKHWVSECQTKQSFVRAFTSDNTRGTGWRWIRIDSSCVCVLYSRNHKRRGAR